MLGLADGTTENAAVAKGLLEDLVARGVSPEQRQLFVLDSSKALRAAIDMVFGQEHPGNVVVSTRSRMTPAIFQASQTRGPAAHEGSLPIAGGGRDPAAQGAS